MAIPNDLLDALMKDYKNFENLIGEIGLLKQLTKQLLERAMQTEMTENSATKNTFQLTKRPTILGTAAIKNMLKGSSATSILTSPATGIPPLNRSSSRRGRAVSPVLMTKSSPFMSGK